MFGRLINSSNFYFRLFICGLPNKSTTNIPKKKETTFHNNGDLGEYPFYLIQDCGFYFPAQKQRVAVKLDHNLLTNGDTA